MSNHLAVGLTEYGAEDVLTLHERALRDPGEGEVAVKVAAATVNPTDTLLRNGQQRARMEDFEPPYIPGLEFSGWVHAVGPGVSDFTVGDRVMCLVTPQRPDGGAQAEFVTLPAVSVMHVPETLNLVEAATIPMNGATAQLAVDLIPGGSRVLVTGGAGAVGGYVIQLAADAGFEVVADAKESDADQVRAFGASAIVPRGEGMMTALTERYPDGFHVVIDAAKIGADLVPAVRSGGRLIRFRAGEKDLPVENHTIAVLTHAEDADLLDRVREAAASGVLTPRVAEVLPPSQVGQAHARLTAGGVRGRLVLEFASEHHR